MRDTSRDLLVFDTPPNTLIKVVVTSFGYLHAPAPDADVTVDLRSVLYNPAADPAMRQLTGLDRRVHDHVLDTPGAGQVVMALAAQAVACHDAMDLRGDKVQVAVGCAGGRHRSVVVANEIGHFLRDIGIATEIEHRDVARPVVDVNQRAFG